MSSSSLCPEPAAEAVPRHNSNQAPGTSAGTSPLPLSTHRRRRSPAPAPQSTGAGAAASPGPKQGLLQAWTRSGAAASLGPPAGQGAGDRRTWGRGINAHQLRNLMHRTCRSRFNQAERRDEPDQPKTGSNNQEDKYQDIIGYNRIISKDILLYSTLSKCSILQYPTKLSQLGPKDILLYPTLSKYSIL